ncbi:MAG TPA: flagellar export protein FliJ [Burkholderiaceae bacterium]
MQALIQLLDHERRVRDASLLGLRDAEGTADAADAQSQQLHAYRSDYVARWSARFREPGSVALMQCYQGFMQRLEQAIAQQRATVQLANSRLEQARQALTDNERRVASVEKLIQRRSQQEQQRSARREQSHSDEIAQRAYARRQIAPPHTEHGDLPR